MIKNWRLTSDIVLMIENTGEGNKVYIASPEKKQFEVVVKKLCKYVYTSETIENTDFEVKIGTYYDQPRIYIRTPKLPTLGWAEVGNFYGPSIWNILKQCNSNHGEFEGKFKVAFSEADPKVVFLVSPEMTEYLEALEEMKRRLRCEIGKKTKTLKPGHRYDLPKETRYYLCPIVSRKLNNMASDFQDDTITSKTAGYIYTNILYPSDSSVSDVLRSRKFGNSPEDLKVAISEGTSWIDGGLKMIDDFSGDIKDYWESIVIKTANSGKVKVDHDSEYTIYSNIPDIFAILGCQSQGSLDYKTSQTLGDELRSIIQNNLEYTLLKYWRLRNPHPELELSDKKEFDKNAEALERLFYESLEDGNIHKFSYYQSLFGRLGIGLNKMSELLVAGFSESDLLKSFEDYMKYRFYWKNKKTIYNNSGVKPILDFILTGSSNPESLFGKTELSDVISELYQYATSNYGDGVSEFRVWENEKKGSDLNIMCCITLEDILKFKKGASGMSDSLKDEIIRNKFDNIIITCKKDE